MAQAEAETVLQWVDVLRSGSPQLQQQAATAIRALASTAANKQAIREAGGIEALLALLDDGVGDALRVVAAESLSCLAADDAANRDCIRRAGGIPRLVHLLRSGPVAECTHRALLALRILTDREADRLAILGAGGIQLLVGLLAAGPDSEVTEYAAAALGNLAAGSQQLKDAIRQAGGIPPLVDLLRDDPEEISAELSAVVLRNLALQNATNRSAIVAAGGLQPLLRLLSMGQEKLVYPMQCEATFHDTTSKTGQVQTKTCPGLCCFDPTRGHLCVAVRLQGGVFACFGGKQASPRDRSAERYSLLRKLTITEPDPKTLELNFMISDSKEGAPRVQERAAKGPAKVRRLERLQICSCSATEIKGAIMRMLTRMHLEKEFRIGRDANASFQYKGPRTASRTVSATASSMHRLGHRDLEAGLPAES